MFEFLIKTSNPYKKQAFTQPDDEICGDYLLLSRVSLIYRNNLHNGLGDFSAKIRWKFSYLIVFCFIVWWRSSFLHICGYNSLWLQELCSFSSSEHEKLHFSVLGYKYRRTVSRDIIVIPNVEIEKIIKKHIKRDKLFIWKNYTLL